MPEGYCGVRVEVVTRVLMADVVDHLKTVDDRLWDVADALFEERLGRV